MEREPQIYDKPEDDPFNMADIIRTLRKNTQEDNMDQYEKSKAAIADNIR